jgi:hypothetical protein
VKTNPIRDLRNYSKQTLFRMIGGGLLLLLIIGDGLIYFIYGSDAAATGLLCILLALAPVIIIGMFLWIMDWIIKRANQG